MNEDNNKYISLAKGMANKAAFYLTTVLMVGTPAWYSEVESKVIKFMSGNPVILTFDSAVPVIETATWKDGSKGTILKWDVSVHEGEEIKKKVLSVSSRRLQESLAALDKKSPLKGRTFKITPLGDGLLRNWVIEEVQ